MLFPEGLSSLARMILAVMMSSPEQAASIWTARMTEFLTNYLAETGAERLESLLTARPMSRSVQDAFRQAQDCFDIELAKIEPDLYRRMDPSQLPLTNLPSLEEVARALPQTLDGDALHEALFTRFKEDYRSLTGGEVRKLVAIYKLCLNRALAANDQLNETIYRLVEEIHSNNALVEEMYSSIKEVHHVVMDKLEKSQENVLGQVKEQPQSDEIEPLYDEFIPRDGVFEALNNLLTASNSGAPRYIVLYGQAGTGKTTIATEIALRLKPGSNQHKQGYIFELVVFHKVNRIVDSAAANEAVEELLTQLSKRLGLGIERISLSNQKEDIRQQLKKYKTLLILDGLRDDVESPIMEFVTTLPPCVRVLITRNAPLNYLNGDVSSCQELKAEGLPSHKILDFLQLYKSDLQLSPDQIDRIYAKTKGNPKALELIITKYRGNFVANLEQILAAAIDPSGDIAKQWIGKGYEELPTRMKQVLHALSLFEDEAHWYALAGIVSSKLPTRGPSESKVKRELHNLEQRSWLNQVGTDYYLMDDVSRDYIRQILFQNDLMNTWRDRWIAYYTKLRQRTPQLRTENGWTVYSDYVLDDTIPLDYIKETRNIIDIVNYCLYGKRSSKLWTNAARLVDDFRAPLFNAGFWQKRIEFCSKVISMAEKTGREDLRGQHYRLLAWMNCFRDNYTQSRIEASEAKEIALHALFSTSGISPEQLTVHQQTFYKSLITLGQISLRQGHQSSIVAQFKHREHEAEEASDILREARTQFARAREHFREALGWIRAFYPDEVLIVEFHLAEVDYQDRHFFEVSMDSPESHQRLYSHFRQLERIFSDLLDRAEFYLKHTGNHRRHQRLTSYCLYYLGKIQRRMAVRTNDNIVRTLHFDDALTRLTKALERSVQYGDRVLEARTQLALGQWHESKVYFSTDEEEGEQHRVRARELIQSAVAGLSRWGMKLESQDAANFLERRLAQYSGRD